jgi:putative addiction module component (TIGR02574 family)
MRPFTVYVPENKIPFFKDLLNNLHFKVKEEENAGFELTDAHKAILDQRLSNYKNDPDSYLDWEEVQKDIEKIL